MTAELIRVARFFACLLIAFVPVIMVGVLDAFGFRVGPANAGWALICTILLLSYIAL